MNCPKCGAEIDIAEEAKEQGWRKMPSIEWFRDFLRGWNIQWEIKNDLAQALHDAILEGE